MIIASHERLIDNTTTNIILKVIVAIIHIFSRPLFNHLLHFLLSCDTMAISYKERRQTYEYYKGF
jgi:hypothetical protein